MLVSVIIPTFNRKRWLEKCLGSLLDQSYKKYELIVVDNGSTDGTFGLVKALQRNHRNLICLRCEKKGASAARNFGLKIAKGGIVSFIDDDCEVERDWIKNLIKAHQENGSLIIGGSIVNEGNIFVQAIQIAQEFWLSTIHTSRPKNLEGFLMLIRNAVPAGTARFVNFLPSNNFSFKRKALKDVFFDETFDCTGEDLELCQALQNKGYKLFYSPTVKVKHHPSINLFSFIKKYYLYGRGFGCFKKKYKSYNFNIPDSFLNSVKFFIEPLLIPFVLSYHTGQIKKKILFFPLFFLQEISFRTGFLKGYHHDSFV